MKKIATDNSRPAVLARIAELEKAGRFDEHTDPVDMSIAMPVTPDFLFSAAVLWCIPLQGKPAAGILT